LLPETGRGREQSSRPGGAFRHNPETMEYSSLLLAILVPVMGEAISVIAVLVLIASLVDYNAVHEEVRALRPDEYKRSLNLPAMDTFIWNSPLSPGGRRRYMRAAVLLCISMGLLALGRFIQGDRTGTLVLGFGFALLAVAAIWRVRDARGMS
jgi:hypothetical protein